LQAFPLELQQLSPDVEAKAFYEGTVESLVPIILPGFEKVCEVVDINTNGNNEKDDEQNLGGFCPILRVKDF
jgi:hypothetical protein